MVTPYISLNVIGGQDFSHSQPMVVDKKTYRTHEARVTRTIPTREARVTRTIPTHEARVTRTIPTREARVTRTIPTREARVRHKAVNDPTRVSIKPGVKRGFASATPGSIANKCKPAKRATEHTNPYKHWSIDSAARFAGLISINVRSWGCARKASLHPRLYAFTCFAGWIGLNVVVWT